MFQEDLVESKAQTEIDDETFFDLELLDILEVIDFTQTTIGGQYLYQSLYNGNKQIYRQGKYIESMDHESVTEILWAFYYLEKEYIPLTDFKENIESLKLKHILILMICDILLLFLIIISFFDIFYVRFIILSMFINIFMNMQFLILSCQKLNEQLIFIKKIDETLLVILKTKYREMIDDKTKQAVYELHHLLKIERIMNVIEKVDIFDFVAIIDAVFFIRYFQAYYLKKYFHRFYHNVMICYQEIGLIDQSLSVKLLRENFDVCIPKIIDDEKIIMKDGYHPLIKNPVKNSLNISNDMIITGSNASGKSTFLRVVGVNLVLAKAIHTCFAREFLYYPYRLMTCIHMKDEILLGNSYYVAELKRFEKICQVCQKDKYLILVDEILKGTNEKERIQIAKAILSYLLKSQSLSIVTTHDIVLAENFEVEHYCFDDIKTSKGIQFDYCIKPGICCVGNAIAILKQLQFDKEIIKSLENG